MATTDSWSGYTSDVTIAVTSVVSDLTEIETITIREGAQYLWAEFRNSDISDLDAFEVAVKPFHRPSKGQTSSFHIIANTAADFTTDIKEPILGCSSDLTTLPKATAHLLWMMVKGLAQVRFRASSKSTGTTKVGVKWSVR